MPLEHMEMVGKTHPWTRKLDQQKQTHLDVQSTFNITYSEGKLTQGRTHAFLLGHISSKARNWFETNNGVLALRRVFRNMCLRRNPNRATFRYSPYEITPRPLRARFFLVILASNAWRRKDSIPRPTPLFAKKETSTEGSPTMCRTSGSDAQ